MNEIHHSDGSTKSDADIFVKNGLGYDCNFSGVLLSAYTTSRKMTLNKIITKCFFPRFVRNVHPTLTHPQYSPPFKHFFRTMKIIIFILKHLKLNVVGEIITSPLFIPFQMDNIMFTMLKCSYHFFLNNQPFYDSKCDE